MNISVLGCGRWGTFIAWYLNRINHNVTLWGRNSSHNLTILKETHKNEFLELPENVHITSDLEKAVCEAEVIVISISAQNLRDLISKISQYNLENKIIVLCMKGIECSTGKRLTQVVRDYVKDNVGVAVWVGPGHVQDFVNNIPNCMVIDSENSSVKDYLIKNFSSNMIRFYYGTDLIGSEIGAAAKNVIGIAAGILDGMNLQSLKGALMSRGTREIACLIKAMGGNELSAYGLCHLGDYEATLFSLHSRNRKFGEALAKGENFDKLAEGDSKDTALVNLGKKYKTELPICNAVNNVIHNKKQVSSEFSNLFLRSLKQEF